MEKRMRMVIVVTFIIGFTLTGCARYNTQLGTGVGAVIGGIAGQLIGGDSKSTMIGAGVGAGLGLLGGNMLDQYEEARREAATSGHTVTIKDPNSTKVVQAIPGPINQKTHCRKVMKRVWDKGVLVSETTEEVCEGTKTTNSY